jgi:hypothetical protein
MFPFFSTVFNDFSIAHFAPDVLFHRHMFLRTIRSASLFFEWSAQGRVYKICSRSVKLSKKFKKTRDHRLPGCVLRKSTVKSAGLGTFLANGSAAIGQILLHYGGQKISIVEADHLKTQANNIHFVAFLNSLCFVKSVVNLGT